MKFGIVVLPGSNCDHDCYYVVKHVLGKEATFLWHRDRDLKGVDCIILPGGFSYGDYLRPGAIGRFSPIMEEVVAFARKGGPVIGICNGFQILTEAGLLPGALMRNRDLRFICDYVWVRVERKDTPFTSRYREGEILRIPIAHNDGNYVVDEDILKQLEDNNQIVFRYCNREGVVDDTSNPNGSMANIAGVCNRDGNVLGMMPHPERCCEAILGGEDGKGIFQSIIETIEGGGWNGNR